ncbi:MAG: Thymidylate synthase ThyX [Firmicutes bacterium ADurb.Bin506]|nr:MAG: Thymidylate synthase ThyX [Firmicutes bacterium ADurb.Bin506]
MTRIEVLDHGHVELIGSMGSDLDIVNGARQSFDEVSILHRNDCPLMVAFDAPSECNCANTGGVNLLPKDAGLVNFLMREKHTSPFELVTAKLGVMLPIFVAREWMRHRTQSFNEMSARYTQMPRLFYVPEDIREQKGKPGAYYYEPMADRVMAVRARQRIEAMCNVAFDEYEYLMSEGVAKEQARLVLPVGTYTKMVVSANLLNWMRFLSLRNHEHAQYEIRVYAEAIEKLLMEIAPVAMEKFVEHGRLR